jgi:hypothetical protein
MKDAAKFIALHVACTVRRPETWRFHTAGILREIARMEPRVGRVITSIAALL